MQPPLVARALIRIAGWIAPARDRREWYAGRLAELMNWQLLAERGERVGERWPALCRRALADALAERFRGLDTPQILRSPRFVPAAMAVALVLLAGLSHGFAVTRAVIGVARDLRIHPNPTLHYDPRGDFVAMYAAPALLAVVTGVILLAMGCISLRGRGWRYWSYLAFKALGVFAILPLVWIEVGTVVRSWIPSHGWRVTAGVAMVFVFVVAMGRAIIWTVADQRRRCPACLRRLVLPVTVGSWASLFEPAATEMLCEDGHGALALADVESNGQDRWTELDDSWRALFR